MNKPKMDQAFALLNFFSFSRPNFLYSSTTSTWSIVVHIIAIETCFCSPAVQKYIGQTEKQKK